MDYKFNYGAGCSVICNFRGVFFTEVMESYAIRGRQGIISYAVIPRDMAEGFHIPDSLSIYGNEDIAKDVLSRIWGKRGIFTCTVGNTLTSTIPGVSDAGDTPELTLFTGPADAELLSCGRTLFMKGIPINPGGIPTPATLTMAALELSDMPCFIVNGGCKVMPQVPYIEMGGEYGDMITT